MAQRVPSRHPADTIVDVQQLDADTQKMQDYCIQNPDVPLMKAVEAVFLSRN